MAGLIIGPRGECGAIMQTQYESLSPHLYTHAFLHLTTIIREASCRSMCTGRRDAVLNSKFDVYIVPLLTKIKDRHGEGTEGCWESVIVAVNHKPDSTVAHRNSQWLGLYGQDLHKFRPHNPSLDGEGLMQSSPHLRSYWQFLASGERTVNFLQQFGP